MSVLTRLLQRDRPPGDVLGRLARDERVVGWATTTEATAVVATQLGLWLPAPDGPPERVSWHLVNKAVWRDGTLTVTPALDAGDGVLEELPPRAVPLAVPRNLPVVVRSRVENSIVFSRHFSLPPTGGVRVVGRRVPGRDGLSWQAVFDPATDRDNPLVCDELARLVQRAQAALSG